MAEAKEFEDLLAYLRVTRGFDFGSYKRTTLMRRIEKRMQAVDASTFSAYLDYLQVHQGEFALLFNTILINVTAFFRDRAAWQFLREDVIPGILEKKQAGDQVRVWTAGCASGEEAYSLAALFAEAMGPESFKSRVKLYATDLDEDALLQSRQATYAAAELHDVDPEIVERYFEPSGDKFVFDRDLRRSVIFGKHDLISDAPISRIDLIVCRNTLMYFNTEVQEKVLTRFHFALSEGGFLFLGKAETMLNHGSMFKPYELKYRIFTKNGTAGPNRERLLAMAKRDVEPGSTAQSQLQIRLRDLALDASPVAQIVLSANNLVVLINERARSSFNLTPRDIGRPLQDLELSYKPLELRSLIEQAHTQRRPLTIREVAWEKHVGDPAYLDVQIVPLNETLGNPGSTSITFIDVTDFKRLQEELHHFNQELETAYEELQSTNEELQTTNEELQSTVEELETTNEELHSTNEELETMNEELQSANEELETINNELQRTSDDFNRSNAFLGSVLSSLRAGVIVVDTDMKVLAWSDRSEDLWGLRSNEVTGRHLLNLDMGFPVDTLRQPFKNVLTKPHEPVEYEAECINRRGKPICCRVSCSILKGADAEPMGVIIAVEDID